MICSCNFGAFWRLLALGLLCVVQCDTPWLGRRYAESRAAEVVVFGCARYRILSTLNAYATYAFLTSPCTDGGEISGDGWTLRRLTNGRPATAAPSMLPNEASIITKGNCHTIRNCETLKG